MVKSSTLHLLVFSTFLLCIGINECRRLHKNADDRIIEEVEEKINKSQDEYEDLDDKIENGGSDNDIYDDAKDWESNAEEYQEGDSYNGDNKIYDGEYKNNNNDIKEDKNAASSDGRATNSVEGDYYEKLLTVRTIEDFKRVFNIPDNYEDQHRYAKRQDVIPTAVAELECIPRATTYEIPFTSTTSYIWPRCIPVQRCGGCCPESKQKCVVKTKSQQQINVYKINQDTTAFEGYYTVDYENDVDCECQCKIKSDDCVGLQTYDSAGCSCQCLSSAKPANCPVRKQWSWISCDCVCNDSSPSCPPNHQWNTVTCQCDSVTPPTCSTGTLNSTSCLCK